MEEKKQPNTEPADVPEPDFKRASNLLRGEIDRVGQAVLEMKEHTIFCEDVLLKEHEQAADFGEMKANIMLSYRHLEDARMRLGKAIQALEGGVSIFDK